MSVVRRPRGVVIVAYHAVRDLDLCLAALGGNEHVVVVDNSSDPDVHRVSQGRGAEYVDATVNLGFAGGVELGLRRMLLTLGAAQHPDVLLLNPDAQFTAEALDALQVALRPEPGSRIAAVAPTLFDPAGREQQVEWPWPSPAAAWREALGLPRRSRGRFLTGSILLLNGDAIAEVGPLDRRFFLYAEETDWQRRARLRGWELALAPAVSGIHLGSGTSTDSGRRWQLFHAGQETYIRRWFGPAGWTCYRLAVLSGAIARSLVLPGERRRVAILRAKLYARGPRNVAGLVATGTPLRIVHVVATNNFAGTERYVADVASQSAALGHQVVVIGGDPARMRAALSPRVGWLPGATVGAALGSATRAGSADIVHAHLTAADFVGFGVTGMLGGRLISTRHIAAPRGSSRLARRAGHFARHVLAAQISISHFVAAAVESPSVVLHNGVDLQRPRLRNNVERVVLVAQRLESEKDTYVAVRAFAQTDLGRLNWELHIAGEGAERVALEQLAAELGIAGRVRFLGWVPDVAERMSRAALLLATAPAEPLGLSVLEAMARAVPVVAAAGGGHMETVGHVPENGLFPPGDVTACAAAVKRLASDQDEAEAYGLRLQEAQRASFHLRNHVDTLLSIYSASIAPDGGGADAPERRPQLRRPGRREARPR